MTGHELFEAIKALLGPEANRHRGVDAPARRDTAIAGGSYRSPGTLVDGFRAGDADVDVRGIVVAARASTAVLREAHRLGANIVISRQAFLGDSQDRPVAKPEPALAAKIAFIEANRMAVLRLQDPRLSQEGREIAQAFASALGLREPQPGNPARGLVYPNKAMSVRDLISRVKSGGTTSTVRLVGDPGLRPVGIAFATETNRPNALTPLMARPDVGLLVAGEVHETETTAYVADAIALGQPKALLLVGSIAMEEPAAKRLSEALPQITTATVTHLSSSEELREVA